MRSALARIRQQWVFIFEATVAATVAWVIDTHLIGHAQPFFAPAASLIVLGQARGQRNRRAFEVLVGVAAGVLVADVVAGGLGRGTTVTIALTILITLSGAVIANAAPVFLVQAAV